MLRRALVALVAALAITAGLAACDVTPTGPDKALNLPRVPWAGGPAYWAKFPDAVKAGWSDPNFFPVVGFWMFWSGRDDLQWYKDHGINAFIYGNEGSQSFCDLQAVGGMSWIGSGGLQDAATCSDATWPGTFDEDEVDGQNSEAAGKAKLAAMRDANRAAHPDKAIFNNFTGMVVEQWYADSLGNGYVNDYQDATSADVYFATDQQYRCTGSTWWSFIMAAPADVSHCRDPQSYGKVIDGLRTRDATDGKLQPLSAYVEDGSTRAPAPAITPETMKAAAVSTLIHGAGFLSWFNNSWAPGCESGNVLRDARLGVACVQANAAAMGEVNAAAKALAPWLNSQAYAWNFGPGLETRLSVHGDVAVILAETDGGTGSRTFTLPPDLAGVDHVVAVDKVDGTPRALPVTDGTFVDTFAANTDYRAFVVRVPG